MTQWISYNIAFNEAHEATEYHTDTVLMDQNKCTESLVMDDDYPEEMFSDEGVDECSYHLFGSEDELTLEDDDYVSVRTIGFFKVKLGYLFN